FFFDRNRQRNTARELAPVTFLNKVVLYIVLVTGGQCAANAERVVSDADVQVVLVDSGSASLYDQLLPGFVYIDGELTWQVLALVPLIRWCHWSRTCGITCSGDYSRTVVVAQKGGG